MDAVEKSVRKEWLNEALVVERVLSIIVSLRPTLGVSEPIVFCDYCELGPG